MKDNFNTSFDIELSQSKNQSIKVKYLAGVSINKSFIKFTPALGGLLDWENNSYGINFKSSLFFFDISCSYYFNDNTTYLESEFKINSNLYDNMPLNIGLRLESENYSNFDNSKVKRDNNVWIFSEIGCQVANNNELGFRFETILFGNKFERKNLCIREKINNGLACVVYLKNNNKNKEMKLSGKIGKLDYVDCLGDVDTVDLNNFRLTFY